MKAMQKTGTVCSIDGVSKGSLPLSPTKNEVSIELSTKTGEKPVENPVNFRYRLRGFERSRNGHGIVRHMGR
jgi:hypothetical protein